MLEIQRRRRDLIKALVFDFDGLIIDTETLWHDTWSEVFDSYGVKLEREAWEGSIGGADFDIYQLLEELSGQYIEREVVRPRARSRYRERVERNPVLPGVEDYLIAARDMELKLAVASSSGPGWAVGNLEKRGLLRYFEFVLSAGDVTNVKPDPELYATAAHHLGACPQDTLAIEDSANGLASAKSAGLYCVVVPNPMTKDMNFNSADIRLNSLSDMPLENLLKELQHRIDNREQAATAV